MAAVPGRALVDTGPLVAWFDASDAHHAPVRAYMDSFTGELLSTWPVITEVSHLLPERLVPGFLRWIGAGGLTVLDLPLQSTLVMADRMDKYADLPMDLADASLVWAAEMLGVLDILTLDRRDFGIYRTERGRSLRNALEQPAAKAAPKAARKTAPKAAAKAAARRPPAR